MARTSGRRLRPSTCNRTLAFLSLGATRGLTSRTLESYFDYMRHGTDSFRACVRPSRSAVSLSPMQRGITTDGVCAAFLCIETDVKMAAGIESVTLDWEVFVNLKNPPVSIRPYLIHGLMYLSVRVLLLIVRLEKSTALSLSLVYVRQCRRIAFTNNGLSDLSLTPSLLVAALPHTKYNSCFVFIFLRIIALCVSLECGKQKQIVLLCQNALIKRHLRSLLRHPLIRLLY